MGIKYSIDEKFFDTWSSKMAYILGFIYADGSLHDCPDIRAKYFRITSTDPSVLKFTKNCLKSEHSISKLKRLPKEKQKYLFQVGSHKIFNSLKKHGLYPNKSLTCKFPTVPKKHLSHFLRGYFDGDGCIHIEYQVLKNGTRGPKRLRIIFTSGSKAFLDGIVKSLDQANISYKQKIYNSSRAYRLILSTKESVELLKFLYADTSNNKNFYLKRKKEIFDRYQKERS